MRPEAKVETERPDKFKRWMIASLFLMPLVIFGSVAGYYHFHFPIKMHMLIFLLRYERSWGWAVKEIDREGETAIPYLLRGLENKNPRVQRRSVGIVCLLAAKGVKDERIVPRLITLLSHPDWQVCCSAAYALGDIKEKDALPHLIKLLSHPNSTIRAEAARSLGLIGCVQAVGPLIGRLKSDPDACVRENAARALGEIGSKEAVGPLIASLKEEPKLGVPPVRWLSFQRALVEGLGKITGQSFGEFGTGFYFGGHVKNQKEELNEMFGHEWERKAIIQKWLGWWQENKEKYE